MAALPEYICIYLSLYILVSLAAGNKTGNPECVLDARTCQDESREWQKIASPPNAAHENICVLRKVHATLEGNARLLFPPWGTLISCSAFNVFPEGE